jgi:hypothetical protein
MEKISRSDRLATKSQEDGDVCRGGSMRFRQSPGTRAVDDGDTVGRDETSGFIPPLSRLMARQKFC